MHPPPDYQNVYSKSTHPNPINPESKLKSHDIRYHQMIRCCIFNEKSEKIIEYHQIRSQ